MKLTRFIPLFIFALLVGFFWRGLSLDPQKLPSMQIGKPIPQFSLPVLDKSEPQFRSALVRGQITLLNVWASWCSSCADEQVFLSQLAQQGITIYGLNYKDNEDDATHWLAEWGNPYKMIGADKDGKVAIELGVYGTPETFLIDKKGVIQYRHAGEMNEAVWQHEFMPRIKQLEQTV